MWFAWGFIGRYRSGARAVVRLVPLRRPEGALGGKSIVLAAEAPAVGVGGQTSRSAKSDAPEAWAVSLSVVMLSAFRE